MRFVPLAASADSTPRQSLYDESASAGQPPDVNSQSVECMAGENVDEIPRHHLGGSSDNVKHPLATDLIDKPSDMAESRLSEEHVNGALIDQVFESSRIINHGDVTPAGEPTVNKHSEGHTSVTEGTAKEDTQYSHGELPEHEARPLEQPLPLQTSSQEDPQEENGELIKLSTATPINPQIQWAEILTGLLTQAVNCSIHVRTRTH